MRTMDHDQGMKLASAYVNETERSLFTLEPLQDYSGSDASSSLVAWTAGKRLESISLIEEHPQAEWRDTCQEKTKQGVKLDRIRLVKYPPNPYTRWEMEFYRRINVPGGERVSLLSTTLIQNRKLELPDGDLMIFDDERAVVCNYSGSGVALDCHVYDTQEDPEEMQQFRGIERIVRNLSPLALHPIFPGSIDHELFFTSPSSGTMIS